MSVETIPYLSVEDYLSGEIRSEVRHDIVLSQNPAQPEVQIYRRSENWEAGEVHRDPAAQFPLRSVGLTLTLGEFYLP